MSRSYYGWVPAGTTGCGLTMKGSLTSGTTIITTTMATIITTITIMAIITIMEDTDIMAIMADTMEAGTMGVEVITAAAGIVVDEED